MTDVAVTTGDLIPIMNDAGGGVYTAGRNNARSNRVGTYGAMFQPDAGGITPRAGVLTDRQSSLGGLWVHQQVTANQTVLVESGQAVIPRTGQGAYLFTNEATQTVAMPAASSVNARYDLVCAFAADKGAFVGDAVHGPQFHVESGAVSGTPTIPATPAGMVALSAFLRPTNGNTIIDSQATDLRKSTCLRGALRRLMGGDALADAGLLVGERRETSTGTDRWNGTLWVPMEIFTSSPMGLIAPPARVVGTGTTTLAAADTIQAETVTGNVISGHRYRITHIRSEAILTSTPIRTNTARVASGASVVVGSPQVGDPYVDGMNGAFRTYNEMYSWVATFTGQATFGISTKLNTGTGQIDNTRGRELYVEEMGQL